MKVKEKAPTAVAVKEEAKAVALPGSWEMELANEAKADTAVEVPATTAFSLQGGILSYNGQEMPNNEIEVIVVASAFEKALFINKYSPDNPIPPLCFALSADGEGMEPHDNSFKKQGPPDADNPKEHPSVCRGCEHLEWSSDTNSPSGKGKACKETRRLALLSVDALQDGVDKAQPAMLRVPVTSVKNWATYVHMLAATIKRPSYAVVTRVYVEKHPKYQFVVNFECTRPINDTELLTSLRDMRERMQVGIMNPYALMTQEQFDEIQAAKNAPKKKAKY